MSLCLLSCSSSTKSVFSLSPTWFTNRQNTEGPDWMCRCTASCQASGINATEHEAMKAWRWREGSKYITMKAFHAPEGWKLKPYSCLSHCNCCSELTGLRALTEGTDSCTGEGSVALGVPLLVTRAHCTPRGFINVCAFVYAVATANTLTTQYMVRFSHLTVQLPTDTKNQWKNVYSRTSRRGTTPQNQHIPSMAVSQ